MATWIGVSSGKRGLNFNYLGNKNICGAELYIDRGEDSQDENKSIFDQLKQKEQIINNKVTFPINWQRLDNRRASRIRIDFSGGYRSTEEEWPELQKKMIDAMNQLEEAIRPEIKNIL
tara:strand:- start:127 stop:480 length:354 start_codon:yes stop_codon:yes gene_type:complete